MSTSKKLKGKTARQKAEAAGRQSAGIASKATTEQNKLPKGKFSSHPDNPSIILVSD